MNTHHSLARTNAPSVTKVGAAFVAALAVAMLTILATGERTQAQQAGTEILTVGPAEVKFGTVSIDTEEPVTREVTVTYSGGAGAIIDLDLLGLNPLNGPFSVQLPGGGNSLTLADGESATLEVQFAPSVSGFRFVDLDFATAAGLNQAPTIRLEGTGFDPSNPNDPNNPTDQPGVQGDCTIIGTDGDDTLTGTAAKDVVCGRGGKDTIDGLGDNDVLRGGLGNDRITDTTGKDKLKGDAGRDKLDAKDGDKDKMIGGKGKDKAKKDKKDKVKRI